MADPDPAAFEKHFKLLKAYGHGDAVPKVRLFSDYHDMLDKMSGELDAVLIATTNHHHAPASILAMEKGLHVYVEKPMASTIEEVGAMRAAAHKYGVATQVGNQGHSDEGVRRFAEYLAAGALGDVKDVLCWTDRVNAYAVEPPPAALPAMPSSCMMASSSGSFSVNSQRVMRSSSKATAPPLPENSTRLGKPGAQEVLTSMVPKEPFLYLIAAHRLSSTSML